MKNLFVITSAINLGKGADNEILRLHQTLTTLSSIREKAPDSDIFILELSREKISINSEQKLQEFSPSKIFYFDDDAFIKSHYERFTQDTEIETARLKNFNETHALLSFFHWAKSNNLERKYSRFFKISGRYFLNERFSIDDHYSMDFHEKCAFIKRELIFFNDDFSNKMRESYMTRLWSFDSVLLDRICIWFDSINEFLHKYNDAQGFIDIEKLLAIIIPNRHCHYPEIMGVSGLIGSSSNLSQE